MTTVELLERYASAVAEVETEHHVYEPIVRRNAAPAAFEALRAVLNRHSPVDRGAGPHCRGCATHVTFTEWPCRTVRDISAILLDAT